MDFHITDDATDPAIARIGDELTAFNRADVGPSDRRAIAVLLRDGDAVTAGLSGYTAWGWLYTQWLWIDEAHRGKGIAGQLLVAAEAEALHRGCHGAYIDTFSPVALRTYRKAGYEIFGVLNDFPQGRTRSFLMKALRA
ncbi:N-acetyltransferase [Devosia yakushimensis]|uniref:N-acetyltransferase n=1 Tax=Devosia yakushimensis TaxID=470028 RepID=A0ABQ5UIM2_9HYPH|nr:GNAT family N-acetyltransferase [Devosia yakushimensis]GLQ11004.1 N-acetyltransferase [Devosia yakushimensis]